MSSIQATDLVKTYPGEVRALDGLSLEVQAGTIFGLLGPNGAGKSTTVKILTTLTTPDSGSARVAGEDVLRNPDRVRRAIGVVAQRSGVDQEATGRENLLLAGQLYGLGGHALAERVDALLERFGLADAGGRLARTYSGGMQRKLDVAMGLVQHPQVLFLDEPTTGLDPETRADMWQEISHLAADEGLTILLTTHYLEEADRLAQRLAIVDQGRVVASGTPEELKGQLRGDAIQIELADVPTPAGASTDAAAGAHARATGDPASTNGRATELLAALDGLREVVLDGRSLRARADSGAVALPAALAALESAGIAVASATLARPSLDDVYLRHAGRAFGEADRDRHAEGIAAHPPAGRR
ncbi:MAG TPA: ATP-binding cassette domain-containing protein [Solirubrobacteraceae bacterium]|jgi:ABC-2 type transport system ATP-binding protein|nr:ATP-binding cassette domain-containing protein [Solirubrobacteraceae bacterium]